MDFDISNQVAVLSHVQIQKNFVFSYFTKQMQKFNAFYNQKKFSNYDEKIKTLFIFYLQ